MRAKALGWKLTSARVVEAMADTDGDNAPDSGDEVIAHVEATVIGSRYRHDQGWEYRHGR